jgi:molybdopterin converting factor small subunit
MIVRVRTYAALREAVGSGAVDIEVRDRNGSATAGDVLDALAAAYPGAAAFREVMRPAVDDSYVRPDSSIPAGSEVHVITPVSGG